MTDPTGATVPGAPDVAELRAITVHARAIVDQLSGLSGATDESSANYARLRALSAGEAWQNVREGVSEQDSNSFVLGVRTLLTTGVPLADAPADLRPETDLIEQELRALRQEYRKVLVPLYNANGQGLRPDLAAELAQRLPELADLV